MTLYLTKLTLLMLSFYRQSFLFSLNIIGDENQYVAPQTFLTMLALDLTSSSSNLHVQKLSYL